MRARRGGIRLVGLDEGDDTLTESCDGAVNFMVIASQSRSFPCPPQLVISQIASLELREEGNSVFARMIRLRSDRGCVPQFVAAVFAFQVKFGKMDQQGRLF